MAGRRTEDRHPAAGGLHALPAAEALRRLHAAQVAAAQAVAAAGAGIAAAAEAAAEALAAGRRVIYCGAGSSGLMALSDALELAGTFGIAPERTPVLFAGGAGALLHLRGAAEDDPALAAADIARTAPAPGEVLIAVSASGGTPYTLEAARLARAAGARVAAVANVAGSPLLRAADLPVLLDTGPEMVAGSTRMGAGTAQKIALNMISTLAGIRLGHVHDGYMVNLTADNAKLAQRAAGIVAAVAGCAEAPARAALALAGGAVKPAILIARGATPERAQGLLANSGGHLGPALAGLGA